MAVSTYEDVRELGAGEIVFLTADGYEVLSPPNQEMKICSFLWVYYGYPTSCYEGVTVVIAKLPKWDCIKRGCGS